MAKRSRSRSKSRSRKSLRRSRSKSRTRRTRSIRRSPRGSRMVMTPRGPVPQQSMWQKLKASPSAASSAMSKQWQRFKASPWAKRTAYGALGTAGAAGLGYGAYKYGPSKQQLKDYSEKMQKAASSGYGSVKGYGQELYKKWFPQSPPSSHKP
jgi:hypothetical protein